MLVHGGDGFRVYVMSTWETIRARCLRSLVDAVRRGEVDEDIVDMLLVVNACPLMCSVSSCSGRIAVFAAPLPGDKRGGGIVAKWHRRVGVGELARAISTALGTRLSYVWVSVQPLVLALYVYGEDVAWRLTRAVQGVGFKYSLYRRARDDVYYVVVLGTERVDVPIAFRGVRLIGSDVLSVICEMLNSYMTLIKSKLERLKRVVTCLVAELGYDEATLRRLLEGMKRKPTSLSLIGGL